MSNAEQKVKSVYPNAEFCFRMVRTSCYDWSTAKNAYFGKDILTHGIWIGNRCLVYGGNLEGKLWRRAWRQIQRDMLEKLEA